MKQFFSIACIACLLTLATSCHKQSSETWEDVKTAGRYIHRGLSSILGNDGESRLVSSNEEFIGPQGEDFIPLSDQDLKKYFSDATIAQPKRFPGEKGSNLPGIDKFIDPSGPLSAIFRNLHFETDDHVLKDKMELEAINKMASCMKKNPNLYLVIQGHCDERASADYNMALGMRRAQYVRVLLCKQGINPNRIYTISCGKEKPLALGHAPEDWHANRRAQFKLYEK